MRQLSLGLGILPQISQTSTYDPYWDEITQQDDSVGGQPLDPESQIENPIEDDTPKNAKVPQKLVGENNENPDVERLTVIGREHEAPWLNCLPTIGARIRDTSPLRPHDKEGVVLEMHSTWCEVIWDGWGTSSHHCLSDLELAPQQSPPCEIVGGQVKNATAHQHDFTNIFVGGQVKNTTKGSTHKSSCWVEKYPVTRNGEKYYYWRIAWREGTKKQRKYLGSCANPHVKERVREVKSAIALGKNFNEILEMI